MDQPAHEQTRCIWPLRASHPRTRFIWLLLLAAHGSLAGAAPLHKCLDAGGVPSYQSAPCGEGQRTAWVREVAAEPVPARPAAAVGGVREPPAPRRPAAVRLRATPPDRRAQACAAERRAADEQRSRHWNRLSFRERSELDAKVARACGR